MSIMSWFSHRQVFEVVVPAEKGLAQAAGAPKKKDEIDNVASLVSTDSLATFGGGTFGITIIWGVWELVTGTTHNLLVGLIIAAVFGACLFGADIKQRKKQSPASLQLRILAAVVNTCIIFGAANTAMTAKESALNRAVPSATSQAPNLPK
jgi:glucose dehydrogenase